MRRRRAGPSAPVEHDGAVRIVGHRIPRDVGVGGVAQVDAPPAVVGHGVPRDLHLVAHLDADAVLLVSHRRVVLDRRVVGVDVEPDAVAQVVVKDAVSEHEPDRPDELRAAGRDAAARRAVPVVGRVGVRDVDAVHRDTRAVRAQAVPAAPGDRAAVEKAAVEQLDAGVVRGGHRHVVDRPVVCRAAHLDPARGEEVERHVPDHDAGGLRAEPVRGDAHLDVVAGGIGPEGDGAGVVVHEVAPRPDRRFGLAVHLAADPHADLVEEHAVDGHVVGVRGLGVQVAAEPVALDVRRRRRRPGRDPAAAGRGEPGQRGRLR